jgi:hypothetical protein
MSQPLGLPEIADMLGVEERTVQQWIRRDLLPDPTYKGVNGSPAWERDLILRWAGDSGRLRSRKLVAEFRLAFDAEPWPARAGGRVPSGRLEPRKKKRAKVRAARTKRAASA